MAAVEEDKETTYSYKAVDNTDHVTKGVLDAKNQDHAIAKLKAKGLIPIEVVKGTAAVGLDRDLEIPGMKKRPKLTDLSIMARQLATMVDAGLPLIKALGIGESQATNKILKETIHETRMDVESGQSLSTALSRHDDVFPMLMIFMIKAGEEGGFLPDALISVADNFEADVKLKRQIKSAMAYPVVVLVIALIAVNAMVIFIVPVFANMFKSMGGNLPPLTQFLVFLNKITPIMLPVSIAVIIAMVVWWRKNKNKESVRKVADKLKLKMPVFGDLNLKISLTRFSRNLSTMLTSAVPIIQALSIVGETSGNWYIEEACHHVAENIRQGASLGTAMAQEDIFPTMLVQMVVAGEGSGATNVMLEKNAEFYDQEVQAMTAALTSLLEPLMIVFLGGIIGTMVVALYLPMFSIFTQIQQSNNM
jgi:type IV pilus assembly protein PilC